MAKQKALTRAKAHVANRVVDYKTPEEALVVREPKQRVIDRELKRLVNKHGSITSELVLQEAKNAKHPLHRFFDWDDGVAAQKWRLAQASAIILSSKMVAVLSEQNGTPTVLATCKVRALVAPDRGHGFRMRKEVLEEKDSRDALIHRKVSQLRSWCRETIDIEELRDLREDIERKLPAEPK